MKRNGGGFISNALSGVHTNLDASVDWAVNYNKQHNIFFLVNESGNGAERKKTDISRIRCFHVDLDSDGTPEAKAGLLAKLTTERSDKLPEPSLVVDSAGGYHAYWLLKEPADIVSGSKGQGSYSYYEVYNRGIAAFLGGDKGYDVSRVLRVPGTINRVSKKKREGGRVDSPCGIIFDSSDKRYDVGDFSFFCKSFDSLKSCLSGGTLSSSVGFVVSDISLDDFKEKAGDLEPIQDLWAFQRSYGLSSRTIEIIRTGVDSKAEPRLRDDGSADRSRWGFTALTAMLFRGVPEKHLISLLLDKAYEFGAFVRDCNNPLHESVRQVNKAVDYVNNNRPIERSEVYIDSGSPKRAEDQIDLAMSETGKYYKNQDKICFVAPHGCRENKHHIFHLESDNAVGEVSRL